VPLGSDRPTERQLWVSCGQVPVLAASQFRPDCPTFQHMRSTTRVFAALYQLVEIWRAGQNKTANTYVIEITL
jgi:hypothetical protein